MELKQLKTKLARGSLAGLARVGLAVPLYLIMTPFVLRTLGPELFGLWSFGTLVISVMTLTDFGFKGALIYHIAGDPSDHLRVNQYFTVAFLSYLIMALSVLLVTFAFGDEIAFQLLRIPHDLQAEAWFVLWITAASFGLRFLSIPFQALVESHQEHATVQVVLLGWLLANFAGTLIALGIQPDIYALGIVTLCSNALVLLIFWLYVRRRYPSVRIAPAHVTRTTVKSMLGYGSGIQAATILVAAREPVIKVLIARTYDLVSVATFEVVYKLCTQLVSPVTTPLLGSFAASALLSNNRLSELEQVLRTMYGFCISIFVPSVLFMASFSQPLVELWLGHEYHRVGAVLPIAFAAFAIYYSTEILYKAIEASGMSGYSALVQFVSLSATIGAFYVFTDVADRAISAALLSGFVIFSLLNMFMFRWRFPEVKLIGYRQWLWLLVPAMCYLALLSTLPHESAPLLFMIYAAVHAWAVRRAGLFDFIGITRKLIGVMGAKA